MLVEADTEILQEPQAGRRSSRAAAQGLRSGFYADDESPEHHEHKVGAF